VYNPVVIAKRLSALRRAGHIDALTCQVGVVLLWECRAPGHDEIQVSYRRLAELTGIGETKTKEAIATLKRLGVLTWRRTCQWIFWCGSRARRQGRNAYRFLVPGPEVARRPTNSGQEKKEKDRIERKVSPHRVERALAALGRALTGAHEESPELQDQRARERAAEQIATLRAMGTMGVA
jgi:hypothetical protein